MITVYPFDQLGHIDHGWLNTRHHFSFANYYDPHRIHFSKLRVVNDDRIAAGKGFGLHPHDNMEIITYVRKGAITHQDSMGNTGRTAAGDVQVMSAGTGVYHSEHNLENEETILYQIWIFPNIHGVEPTWAARRFPKAAVKSGSLPVLVSGRADEIATGALPIYQDAAIYGGRIKAGGAVRQDIRGCAYLLASLGLMTVNGVVLAQGDGAEVVGEKTLDIVAESESEVLVIDLPDDSES